MSSSAAPLIREATVEDCPQISVLIEELNQYEGVANSPHVDARALQEQGFGERPVFRCLVAVDGGPSSQGSQPGAGDSTSREEGGVVGYVLFCYGFDRHGKHVYMEDLYVSPAYRSKGLGTRLWRNILKLGLDAGAKSCRFCVLDWNAPSIAFYKSKGAQDVTAANGFHFFGMTKDLVEKLAARRAPSIESVAVVRAATETDVEEILGMQQQLGARLGEQGQGLTKQELHDAIFRSNCCQLMVVEEQRQGGALLGYILFSVCFTTWQGLCFEVYEVYVKPGFRSMGVGLTLMQHVTKHCLSLGCQRCDFLTAPDSAVTGILAKMEAVDLTLEEGWRLMFMDESAMVKMVGGGGKE